MKSKCFISNLFFTITVMIFFTSFAHAAFYIEPYVGYEKGSLAYNAVISAPVAKTLTNKDDTTGLLYGAKLAYSMGGYGVGGDLMLGKISGDNSGTKTDYKIQDIGALVQARFANRYRLAATYFFKAKLTDDGDGEQTGKGFKINFGYVILNHLSLNADYISINYDEGTLPNATIDSFKDDRKAFCLGISFPYEI